jgi:hypothetical protein
MPYVVLPCFLLSAVPCYTSVMKWLKATIAFILTTVLNLEGLHQVALPSPLHIEPDATPGPQITRQVIIGAFTPSAISPNGTFISSLSLLFSIISPTLL